MKSSLTPRKKIHLRIRKNLSGTAVKPRLAVFRSNKNISCQLIDDTQGVTIASSSSDRLAVSGTKSEQAKATGLDIASKAKGLNIESVTFDRAGFVYHGRIKALADGAREGGLKF